MTWFLNLAPFRWWRARHMPPLVMHGPKTRWASLASRIAEEVERDLILGNPYRCEPRMQGLCVSLDRAKDVRP